MEVGELQCQVRVLDSGGWHSRLCGKMVKIVVDGKGFCGIHDPVAVALREEKRNARYAAKQARWKANCELQAAQKSLIDEARLHNPPCLAEALKRLREVEKGIAEMREGKED